MVAALFDCCSLHDTIALLASSRVFCHRRASAKIRSGRTQRFVYDCSLYSGGAAVAEALAYVVSMYDIIMRSYMLRSCKQRQNPCDPQVLKGWEKEDIASNKHMQASCNGNMR